MTEHKLIRFVDADKQVVYINPEMIVCISVYDKGIGAIRMRGSGERTILVDLDELKRAELISE